METERVSNILLTVLVLAILAVVVGVCLFIQQKERNELCEARERESNERQELNDHERKMEKLKLEIGNMVGGLKRAQRDSSESVYPRATTIDAAVLAVKPEVNLVMLSVGSNAGVQPGYHFTISRDGKVKGYVQVDKVWPDMSSARWVHDTQRGSIICR